MKIDLKLIVKVSIQVLIYTLLMIFFTWFFMIDQMGSFLSKRSTITSRMETANSMEFPTIIFCLDPATKLSIAKKYGFESIDDKFFKVDNESLVDVFDEITFKLNEDFEITNFYGEKFKLGSQMLREYKNEGRNFSFAIQGLRTHYFGTCYKLEPKFVIRTMPIRFRFRIKLNQNIKSQDRPKTVFLQFVSKQTWIGVPLNLWPQFQPLRQYIDFEKEYTHIYVKVVEKKFREVQENNGKCLKKLLEKKNCSVLCSTITFADLPPCQTADQYKCNMDNSWNSEDFFQCYKTQKATTYDLLQRIENPHHKNITFDTTDINIGMYNMEKEIQEEVLILTLQDLIGSVGGSLGMFFGFSISGSLFYCFSFCNKRFLP